MNKLIVFIFAILLSSQVMAREVALVSGLTGNAFMIKNGHTKALSLGDAIEDFAEIYTEEGSQLTLSDHYDHIYYVSGSGHIKFLNKILELKNGYLRIQSYQKKLTHGLYEDKSACYSITNHAVMLPISISLGKPTVRHRAIL